MPTVERVENSRLSAQQELDSLKSAEERNRWGQFATPPGLALTIARYVRSQLWSSRREKVSFLDPAIGTGAFYSALLTAFPRTRVVRAAGVELDSPVAATARSLWAPFPLEIIEADFTDLEPPSAPEEKFNLILTNPPYVRHHHIDRAVKSRLQHRVREELSARMSGLAGLYAYFLLLCHEWMRDRGIAVWLIPSEFMDVNYGRDVKHYLTSKVQLLHIHRFAPSDVQFEDALVTSAIVVFEKHPPDGSAEVRFSVGGSILEPALEGRIPLRELSPETKWTRYPGERTPPNRAAPGITLGDLFSIKRGLATGANRFFILPRDEARAKGIPDAFLRPILPSPRALQGAIVQAGDDGYADLENPLALIDCNLPEHEVQEKYPTLWKYLEEGLRQGLDRAYLTSHRTPWYSQEKRPAAPFMCTYMGRGRKDGQLFRLIWNRSQATAANVYLLLYPTPLLASFLQKDERLEKQLFEVLQAIDPESLRREGRVYGGGLYKLEPKELAALPAQGILDALDIPLRREHQEELFPEAG